PNSAPSPIFAATRPRRYDTIAATSPSLVARWAAVAQSLRVQNDVRKGQFGVLPLSFARQSPRSYPPQSYLRPRQSARGLPIGVYARSGRRRLFCRLTGRWTSRNLKPIY